MSRKPKKPKSPVIETIAPDQEAAIEQASVAEVLPVEDRRQTEEPTPVADPLPEPEPEPPTPSPAPEPAPLPVVAPHPNGPTPEQIRSLTGFPIPSA